jgi:hypothetical protein
VARWPVARCKIEDMNYDPDTGEQRQIYALSIASKRYAPFGYDKDGRPRLLGEPGCYKRSEHGLGHLLDPTSHDVDKPQDRFYDRWWDQILHDELGIPLDQPDWFDRPAVGRLAVTSRHEELAFRAHNADLPYDQATRPFKLRRHELPQARPTHQRRSRGPSRHRSAPMAAPDLAAPL